MGVDLGGRLLSRDDALINGTVFYVPIHPVLFEGGVELDPKLAMGAFPDVAREWHTDLMMRRNRLPGGKERELYDSFLEFGSEVSKEGGEYVLGGMWRSEVIIGGGGFARGLSINRDVGGSLDYNPVDVDCEIGMIPRKGRFFGLSEAKVKEFGRLWAEGGYLLDVYGQHNVDNLPGALFLRNWAVKYLNAAVESVS